MPRQLHASPSEVTVLFTSYLVVTAVAMLITNWALSRLGAQAADRQPEPEIVATAFAEPAAALD